MEGRTGDSVNVSGRGGEKSVSEEREAQGRQYRMLAEEVLR